MTGFSTEKALPGVTLRIRNPKMMREPLFGAGWHFGQACLKIGIILRTMAFRFE
jgi:hypothetical protein